MTLFFGSKMVLLWYFDVWKVPSITDCLVFSSRSVGFNSKRCTCFCRALPFFAERYARLKLSSEIKGSQRFDQVFIQKKSAVLRSLSYQQGCRSVVCFGVPPKKQVQPELSPRIAPRPPMFALTVDRALLPLRAREPQCEELFQFAPANKARI